jgi:subtilase family serine protease
LGLAVILAVELALCAGSPAASGPRAHQAALGAPYASVRQVCPAPRPRAASCLVEALVPAQGPSPGAQLRQRAAGASSVGPAGGLTPGDLASAYGYTGSPGGHGQTLAVVDAYDDPEIEADLATFDAHYGLPACTAGNGCFTKVGQTGSTTGLPAADTRGWTIEMALDVQSAHGACPNCRILLVEANSESFSDLAAAVDEAVALGANEVSNSYGGLEGELGASELSAYDHPGIVITAASGDSGYLNWDRLAEVFQAPGLPDLPASLGSVVAVGGTSLKLKSTGARKSETVWNDSGPPSGVGFKQFSASGGGCSTETNAPAWQSSAPGWAATGCSTKRLGNDVAIVGDPYTGFDIYSSYEYKPAASIGWMTVGGTSLSSPLVAAMYGLAGGARGASYPASTLYAHLGEPSLYDVTAGGNGYCDGLAPGPCGEPEANELLGEVDCLGTTACNATTGFDGPSGVGTPNGLAAFGAPAPTATTGKATSITANSAVLNATINPNGVAVTTCKFEWGPTATYGQSTPCQTLPGAGSSAVAVSTSITGLSAGTYYYFRISAANEAASSTGKKARLKTRLTP